MADRDLTPWSGSRGMSPFGRDPFSSLRQEMDRLFDQFFIPAESRSWAPAQAGGFRPSVDVRETDQAYEVKAELPGLEQNDVNLNLKDNVLTISGEKREERKEEEGGRSFTERTFGRFERTIPFDGEIDAEKVDARFRNGVLEITLPKNPKAKEESRRIEIKSA